LEHTDESARPLNTAVDALSPAPSDPRSPARWALLLLAISIALCLIGYLALAAPGRWFPGVQTKQWSAREMAVPLGRATREDDSLVIAPGPSADRVVVSVETRFRSSEYPVIAWSASGVPDNAQIRLMWRTQYEPGRMNVVQIPVAYNRLLPVLLTREAGWVGDITGLALAIQGTLEQPVRIDGVTANPMGVREVLRARLEEWSRFESWNGSSINTLSGGADVQALPLSAFLFVSALMAIALWTGLAYRRGWLATLPVALGVVFLAVWLVSDARWGWNLVRQARATVAQYGGKDDHARHLAAEDGPLFAFIEHVRAKLPAGPVRIFVASDTDYLRGRAAYHLYPNNVYFVPSMNTIPDPGFLHSGDYMVVYQRKGVQFDPAAGRLRWDGLPPVRAELLLLEAGSALFRLL